jgi:dienelactone hydrolase
MKQQEFPAGYPPSSSVRIPVNNVMLSGELFIPAGATGVVLFAHGSGSSRLSPRNQYVAQVIQQAGVGTLLFDLLTNEEEIIDAQTRHLRFDIELLSYRLLGATRWVTENAATRHLRVGYFGASTGGAAALGAAAALGEGVKAVVSRGGRPDLAGEALASVQAATLLIVGERDEVVLRLNQETMEKLHCHKELVIVPGATHLFEETGALEEVARLAAQWFQRYL